MAGRFGLERPLKCPDTSFMQMTMEARLRKLLEAVEMLHQREDGSPFQTRVFRACQHLFPESCSSLELWDRQTGMLTAAYGVDYDPAGLEERLKRIGEVVQRDHPGFPIIAAGSDELMRLSELTTLREFQKTELYDIGFKPLDIRHQVVTPVQSVTQLGGVTFNRGGSRDFAEEDLEIIRLFSRQVVIAHQNDRVLSRTLEQQPQISSLDHTPLRRAGLTRRESEVFAWMMEGKRDREIATILGISYRTVTNHVHAILRKLGVETRTAATRTMPKD